MFTALETSNVVLHPEPTVLAPPRHLLTPIPSQPGHFLLVLDNTSLEYFTTCPMSAYYKLVLRREAHAKNAALTFGGAVHDGLEVLLKGKIKALGESDTHFVSRQNTAIVNYFTNNPTPLDEYRTVQNALAILEQYRIRSMFPDYQWEILSDEHGLIVERAFELPLGVLEVDEWIDMPWLGRNEEPQGAAQHFLTGSPCYRYISHIHLAWSGRIDVLAHCNGLNRVVDHKTGSVVEPQEYHIANQVLGYVWAARQLWPQHSVAGFCLNAFKFKKPTGSGPIHLPGPRGGQPALEMFRAYFEYTESRISQWERNAIAICEDFVHCLIRQEFPMHTKWCFGKFGRCPYHDVCTIDDVAVRHNLLNSAMYKPVTWDPVRGR